MMCRQEWIALKVIEKEWMKHNNMQFRIQNEIQLHTSLSHPSIIPLHVNIIILNIENGYYIAYKIKYMILL